MTPVRLSFTPGSGYSDTGVVWRAGSAWLATASGTTNVENQVRIFRWNRTGWELAGLVDVPALPSIREGGFVSAVSLTRSGPPDFTVNTYGADTRWFSGKSGGPDRVSETAETKPPSRMDGRA